jgi:hypothetical protein
VIRYGRKGERIARRCSVCGDWMLWWPGGPHRSAIHPECMDAEPDPDSAQWTRRQVGVEFESWDASPPWSDT